MPSPLDWFRGPRSSTTSTPHTELALPGGPLEAPLLDAYNGPSIVIRLATPGEPVVLEMTQTEFRGGPKIKIAEIKQILADGAGFVEASGTPRAPDQSGSSAVSDRPIDNNNRTAAPHDDLLPTNSNPAAGPAAASFRDVGNDDHIGMMASDPDGWSNQYRRVGGPPVSPTAGAIRRGPSDLSVGTDPPDHGGSSPLRPTNRGRRSALPADRIILRFVNRSNAPILTGELPWPKDSGQPFDLYLWRAPPKAEECNICYGEGVLRTFCSHLHHTKHD